jgi:hypothetical protein
MSVPPPGALGTIMQMGFVAQVDSPPAAPALATTACANATPGHARAIFRKNPWAMPPPECTA